LTLSFSSFDPFRDERMNTSISTTIFLTFYSSDMHPMLIDSLLDAKSWD